MKISKIDCFKCRYFYITWEKDFPYSCKAMKFKTKNMPSMVVHQSSGIECLKFEKKKTGTKTA
ncbi:MAG: uracil-DNA glycosylase [Nitrospirae bacterium]|nr:uracil-DNA glycosylase [Nitrospirota bacterium]MCL5977292.1 uracil-DNA glycosylase [Nitrospirota bacterium]